MQYPYSSHQWPIANWDNTGSLAEAPTLTIDEARRLGSPQGRGYTGTHVKLEPEPEPYEKDKTSETWAMRMHEVKSTLDYFKAAPDRTKVCLRELQKALPN